MANLSIFQGLLQPPKSVNDFNMEAAALQAQRLQNTQRDIGNQTATMNNQVAQRGVERANQLLTLSKSLPAGASDLDRLAALRNGGFYDEADKLDTSLQNRVKTTAAAAKDNADAEATTQKTAQTRKDVLLRAVPSFNNSDDVKAFLAKGVLGGHLSMEEAQQMIQRVPNSATDAQGFNDWQLKTLRSLMTPDKQMEYVAPTANTKLTNETSAANNAATNARAAAEGAANRSVQMRGQNLTDARMRDTNGISKQAAAEAKQQAAADKAVTKFSDTLQKEGIPDLETAIGGAESALARYKKGQVPGIGPIKNALPAFMVSDEGKDVRQALASVRNIVLSARSGAAVTDQELRRLVEEIGTGVGMTEDDMRKGLGKIRARIDAIKSNAAAGVDDATLRTYSERGGIPIKRGGAAPASVVLGAADAILRGGK